MTTPRTGPAGSLALAPQQQGEAQGLVQHARKRMRGVDGDGRQQRIDFALEVTWWQPCGPRRPVRPTRSTRTPAARSAGSSCLFQQWYCSATKPCISAVMAASDCSGRSAVGVGLGVAVFNALHQAGLADFDEFVEIAGGDGQELDPLEQGIGGVLGFFEHAPVEVHPGFVSGEKEALLRALRSGHKLGAGTCRPKFT